MSGKTKITFKIKGADEIFKNLRLLPDALRERVIWPATIEAADLVKEFAKENAILSVDRLTTRNYIPDNIEIAQDTKLGREMKAAIVHIGVKRRRSSSEGGGRTFYWWFVELGTSKTRANPFLRPAIENNQARILKEFLSKANYEMSKLRF